MARTDLVLDEAEVIEPAKLVVMNPGNIVETDAHPQKFCVDDEVVGA